MNNHSLRVEGFIPSTLDDGSLRQTENNAYCGTRVIVGRLMLNTDHLLCYPVQALLRFPLLAGKITSTMGGAPSTCKNLPGIKRIRVMEAGQLNQQITHTQLVSDLLALSSYLASLPLHFQKPSETHLLNSIVLSEKTMRNTNVSGRCFSPQFWQRLTGVTRPIPDRDQTTLRRKSKPDNCPRWHQGNRVVVRQRREQRREFHQRCRAVAKSSPQSNFFTVYH
ncbi:hypothetical protein OG21DRAFT_1327233 [Imleria badia]|nr:hypothetical protein OG21DRAFT_1327233 [Imleria badia]